MLTRCGTEPHQTDQTNTELPTVSQQTLAGITAAVAEGGNESTQEILATFGYAPLFAMTAHPMYNTYLQTFVRVVVPLCVDVLNGTISRQNTILADVALCHRWKRRIETWIRRFYVLNAIPQDVNLPSLPAALYHAYLYLCQLDEQTTLRYTDLQQWVREGNVAQLARNFPTLRDFYSEVRTFTAVSTCTRWRCQYGTAHQHPASMLTPEQTTSPYTHAGFGFEEHLANWQARHERLQVLARQLYVQATVSHQMGDTWVEDAVSARKKLTSHSEVQQKAITSASACSSDLLIDRNVVDRAAVTKHKTERLAWLKRTAKAVGGNANDEALSETTNLANHEPVDLTPDEEEERRAAMSFGSSTDAKLLGILMTGTRLFYWGMANLDMVTTRTCVVVDARALSRATKRVRASLDQIMEIEPASEVQVLLTKMIYQTSMACCLREDYLRRFTTQTRATNPITVMNRSLAPDNIAAMQSTFVEKTLREMYANERHEYSDILHLCLWANEINIWTRLEWLPLFCMYGNGFQDMVNVAFEKRRLGRDRRPLVALVLGQWCVLEGVCTLYLCRTSLEAVTLWMLIMWAVYNSETSDRMHIDGFLKRCFEKDQHSTTLEWLTEQRRAQWRKRLRPDDTSVMWKRRPGGVNIALRGVKPVVV